MNSKQTLLDREMFVQALRYMGEDDLLYLNRMVVERLNRMSDADLLRAITDGNALDLVETTDEEG